jgi:hypothetical protein
LLNLVSQSTSEQWANDEGNAKNSTEDSLKGQTPVERDGVGDYDDYTARDSCRSQPSNGTANDKGGWA